MKPAKAGDISVQDIASVIINLMLMQKINILFLESPFLMVSFLIGNVFQNCRHIGFAHTECPVTELPSE